MSILIKGMEIPDCCTRCDYLGLNVAIGCPVMTGVNGRATDCPLIEVPEWIPVTEQLPDYDLVVLVTDGEDVGTGYRYTLGETGFTGWAVPFADIEEDNVSHWMPLPKPPEECEA